MTIKSVIRAIAAVSVPAALTASALSGCMDRTEKYSEFITLENAEWPYARTLVFTPDLPDSTDVGQIELVLRHTHGFRYSNIWLELSYDTSDSTVVADTLNIRLADSFGHWLGSGSGASYSITSTIADSAALCSGRPIRLRHIMRSDTLTGVEQVGLVFRADTH